MNCKIIAVILGILAVALIASADTMSESNTTTDGMSVTVDAGAGQVFVCTDDASGFSCVDPQAFTCYGWANCDALDAVGGFTLGTGNTVSPVGEPNSFALLLVGLAALSAFLCRIEKRRWKLTCTRGTFGG
jgi:hypothetical protein